LRIGGVEFEDQRITSNEWAATAKQDTPYGQVPVLVVEQTKIAQTKNILRYLGKLIRHNGSLLYPEDPLVAAKVDEVLDTFDDVWILLAPTYRIKDKEQKEIARQTLFGPGGEAAAMIGIFENRLKQSSNGFLVPEANGLTVADLAYFCYLNTIRSGFIDGLSPMLFSDCPEIKKHKEKVASIPAIKEYYADSKKSNPGNLPIYEVFKPGR
jgi:glutathione S-transferase